MFFEAEREHFFRPLTSKRREMVISGLRTLYDRLHGPSADYSHNLTRDSLRDLLVPVVQETGNAFAPATPVDDDELSALDTTDDLQLTSALIRALLRDGWLETFGDRAGLVTAYRFTRAGKMFSEVVWELERPRSRTRQRNMRSCRNSLEAAFRNVDAYDLVDAYDHAEKVISDLAEGADYFQELVRRLMVEAALRPWDEFLDFLDRFERDFKKQLTADNVERHRQYIRETLNRLHGLEESKFQGLETQLNDIARWAQDQRSGDSTYRWLLQRIEELVEAACTQKLPELIKAMNDYLRRAASIVQQAFVLRGGQHRHAYARAITKIASLDRSAQDKVLERIGREMASAELRFVDPQSFKLRTASERRKALTVTRVPKVSRQARLNAAVLSAEASAFALSNEDVVTFFRSEIRLLNRPLRLSTLPLTSAIDVLRAMQAVEAIRGSGETGLKVTRLPTRLTNPYYSGFDYQIELLPSC